MMNNFKQTVIDNINNRLPEDIQFLSVLTSEGLILLEKYNLRSSDFDYDKMIENIPIKDIDNKNVINITESNKTLNIVVDSDIDNISEPSTTYQDYVSLTVSRKKLDPSVLDTVVSIVNTYPDKKFLKFYALDITDPKHIGKFEFVTVVLNRTCRISAPNNITDHDFKFLIDNYNVVEIDALDVDHNIITLKVTKK